MSIKGRNVRRSYVCPAVDVCVPRLKPASPDKRWSVVGLRERERRNMRKARGQLSEIVSGLGGSKERVRSNKGEAPNACCVCSGKAVPGAPVASAGMCAGKKIAGGFDRV